MQLLMTSRPLTQRTFRMYLLRVQSYVHMLDFNGLGKATHPLHLHTMPAKALLHACPCLWQSLRIGKSRQLPPADIRQTSELRSGSRGRGDRKLGVGPKGSW